MLYEKASFRATVKLIQKREMTAQNMLNIRKVFGHQEAMLIKPFAGPST